MLGYTLKGTSPKLRNIGAKNKMGIMNFLKGSSDEGVPPDVGQEEIEAVPVIEEKRVGDKKKETIDKLKKDANISGKFGGENKVPVPIESSVQSPQNIGNFEAEKINARMEEMNLRAESINQRLSLVNERIGELRSMNIENEKKILESTKEAAKVIDMFKEVQPDKLRIEYQKMDIRLKTMEEKVNASRQMADSIIKEFTDLKRQSEAFLGTEGLIKLNEDVKRDLLNTQKLSEKTKLYSDKVSQIFMEVKSGFADSEKVASVVNNLNESFSAMNEEVEKLKIGHDKIVKRSDYTDFKKTFSNKISLLDSVALEVDQLKEGYVDLSNLIDDSLEISKRNAEDVGDLALKVGDNSVKRVSDYENQLADVLEIIDKLAVQISEMKEKLNVKTVAQVPVQELKEIKKKSKERIGEKKIEVEREIKKKGNVKEKKGKEIKEEKKKKKVEKKRSNNKRKIKLRRVERKKNLVNKNKKLVKEIKKKIVRSSPVKKIAVKPVEKKIVAPVKVVAKVPAVKKEIVNHPVVKPVAKVPVAVKAIVPETSAPVQAPLKKVVTEQAGVNPAEKEVVANSMDSPPAEKEVVAETLEDIPAVASSVGKIKDDVPLNNKSDDQVVDDVLNGSNSVKEKTEEESGGIKDKILGFFKGKE